MGRKRGNHIPQHRKRRSNLQRRLQVVGDAEAIPNDGLGISSPSKVMDDFDEPAIVGSCDALRQLPGNLSVNAAALPGGGLREDPSSFGPGEPLFP